MKVVVPAIVVVVCVGIGLWVANRPHDDTSADGAVPVLTSLATQGKSAAPDRGRSLHDLWLLKPPAGAEVAVYEFDDLECPSCAHALPIVHAAVEHHGVPLVHRDFPLTEIHVWSFDAAVTARYLQDKVSAKMADEFRRDVFAGQSLIASKDDLAQFTGRWFQAHGLMRPFVIDADGSCENEVRADRALGERIGVGAHGTPCIFVVTQQSAVLVDDVTQLDRTIEAALAHKSS